MFYIPFLLFIVPFVMGHWDEFVGHNDSHLRHNFRAFSVTKGFLALNVSDSRRRLSNEYLDVINNYATASKLERILEASKGYSLAKPFPHMTTVDIFPKEVLDAANLEIPDNPPSVKATGCIKGGRCYNSKSEKSKNAFATESEFGPATKALFAFMHSKVFTNFLEKLTGINEIIPDGSFRGAGIHQTLPGGFLNIHADFNLDKKRGLHRRVNVFIFLNPDWKDEYGGHLELWSRDLKRCDVRISPDLGRLVVFSSTDFSYHGHQSPLSCPADRSRRSLAMYYYTKTRPFYECVDDNCLGGYHSTLFQTTLCPSCHSQCFTGTA